MHLHLEDNYVLLVSLIDYGQLIFFSGVKSMYEQILYDVKDPVAVITFNRPEALNALTGRMQREFKHALAAAESDPAVVGIVLTGSGRGFCAGADIN